MKNLKFNSILVSILAILFLTNVQAQDLYKLQSTKSKLIVTGTSSLHDWEMEAVGFSAETMIRLEGNNVAEIKHVEFSLPASGLNSGKRIMDNKAHEALNEKKFPVIKFSIDKNSNIENLEGKTDVTGLLTLAGKSKKVKVTIDFDIETSLSFQVSGSVPLKMSDFGIEPPTAMMGAMKTGNEVEVSFNLIFLKSDEGLTRK